MNLYIRLILVLLKSFFSKKLSLYESSIRRFLVLPNDADINLHLNNGRYFSIMDLGRIDLTVRCGLMKICIKNKWLPVIGAEMIRFIDEIKVLTSYTVETTFIGHDEKWFYIRQDFYQNNKRKARAYVRGVFLKGKRKVSPKEIITALQVSPSEAQTHIVSDEIKNLWNDTEKKLLSDIAE